MIKDYISSQGGNGEKTPILGHDGSYPSKPYQLTKEPTTFEKAMSRMVFFLLIAANFQVYCGMSILTTFFPLYAHDRYHANTIMVGFIFAAHPIAEIIFCPFASWLCLRLGRVICWRLGVFLCAVSLAGFGLANSIQMFVYTRLLEGVGSSFIQVAGLALLMETSEDLVTDLGVMETIAGTGYALGPLLGGIFYSHVGIVNMYLGFSLVPLAILVLHCLTPQPSEVDDDEDDDNDAEATAGTAINGGRSYTRTMQRNTSVSSLASLKKQQQNAKIDKEVTDDMTEKVEWRALLSVGVIAALLAIAMCAASYGFLDMTLAAHMNRVSGLNAEQSGIVYTIPPILYAVFSFFIAPMCDSIGERATIMIGLFVTGVGYILMGPAPFLHLELSQNGSWILIISCLSLMGMGEVFILIPAIPLMVNSLKAQGYEEDDFTDIIAGLFNFAWSSGDFIGPMIGGVLAQTLPAVHECPCVYADPQACLSGFAYACVFFGAIILVILFIVAVFSSDPEMAPEEPSAEAAKVPAAVGAYVSPERIKPRKPQGASASAGGGGAGAGVVPSSPINIGGYPSPPPLTVVGPSSYETGWGSWGRSWTAKWYGTVPPPEVIESGGGKEGGVGQKAKRSFTPRRPRSYSNSHLDAPFRFSRLAGPNHVLWNRAANKLTRERSNPGPAAKDPRTIGAAVRRQERIEEALSEGDSPRSMLSDKSPRRGHASTRRYDRIDEALSEGDSPRSMHSHNSLGGLP